jgi:ribosomal protein S18 acetylase RimI-like enzyme
MDAARIDIRQAGPEDAALLATGLARLSDDLADDHRMDTTGLRAAFAAPIPPFRAVLAGAEGWGLALYSPVFSTVAGGAGLYVSDLWVAPAARGSGLGRRLLAAAARDAAANWAAVYLTLAVYDTRPAARAFYDRLGFVAVADETRLRLAGAALSSLRAVD